MSETLQFIAWVDGLPARSDVMKPLVEFEGAVRGKENSVSVAGNHVEAWANEDADASLALDEEDGFLYFAWRVECTPLEPTSENAQVELARAVRDAFLAAGARVEIAANFEDLV